MGSFLASVIIAEKNAKSIFRSDSSRYARDADFRDQIRDLYKNRNGDDYGDRTEDYRDNIVIWKRLTFDGAMPINVPRF
jgi:hypothetical protein